MLFKILGEIYRLGSFIKFEIKYFPILIKEVRIGI